LRLNNTDCLDSLFDAISVERGGLLTPRVCNGRYEWGCGGFLLEI